MSNRRETFEVWWRSTSLNREVSKKFAETIFKAGWDASKKEEGYHAYTPPQNTLKEYCTTCHESFENGKHLSEEVKS